MHSLVIAVYELGVEEVWVIGHDDCGMQNVDCEALIGHMHQRGITDVDIARSDGATGGIEEWLRGFGDVRRSRTGDGPDHTESSADAEGAESFLSDYGSSDGRGSSGGRNRTEIKGDPMEKALVIIDGNSLMNRAYYAIQRPMITGDGMYTQGIFGFLNMLNKILTDYEPEYIFPWLSTGKRPACRHLEYKAYKAGRKKMPPELAMQFPVLKEILSAMKIDRIEIDGFEADRYYRGTVAVTAEREGDFFR